MAVTLPIPLVSNAAIASASEAAKYSVASMNMIDPVYLDENRIDSNKSDLPPTQMQPGTSPNIEPRSASLFYGCNTVRMGISPGWFTEASEMPQYAVESLERWIATGKKILWLYANWTNAESYVPDGTNDEKVASLTSVVLARCLATIEHLRVFLDAHPTIKAVSIGFELFNEPAIYHHYREDMADDPIYGVPGYFERLFADHCIVAAKALKAWWKGVIFMPTFRYQGSARDLLASRDDTRQIDRIRRAVGPEQLAWAVHAYPSWFGTPSSSDRLIGAIRTDYAPLGMDRVCITETNVLSTAAVDHPPEYPGILSVYRALQWARQVKGFGTGYFPVYNSGAAYLLHFDGEVMTMSHPWGYGEVLRLWAARGEVPAGTTGVVPCTVHSDHRDLEGLTRGTVTAENVCARFCAAGEAAEAVANAFNVIIGSLAGGHTLSGRPDSTRSFLAAIGGNNTLNARSTSLDVLRGGTGTDIFNANGARVQIDGGTGPAVMNINTGAAFIYTGAGGAAMTFAATGQPHFIYDLKAGDSITLQGWPSSPVVEQVGADVTISAGTELITCMAVPLAVVQASIQA